MEKNRQLFDEMQRDSPDAVRQYGAIKLKNDIDSLLNRTEEELRLEFGDSKYEEAVSSGRIVEHQFTTTLSKNIARKAIPVMPRPDLAIVRMVEEFNDTTQAGVYKGDMAAFEERWQGTLAVIEKLGCKFHEVTLSDGKIAWGENLQIGDYVDLAPLSGDFFYLDGNTRVQYRYVNASQILGVFPPEIAEAMGKKGNV